ncbi:AraC family transcriptional regulator [Azospirillum palustre]|uniref:AraC family transcriptional regulator n=1 Tax=Azospirillum palustre TaxID=2044885 RepID=A0A2B8BDM3_9PROT|nr:AraC family transcriptional regulator [Azospirillum palustre]PGH55648.1 AraC family transcriptional regulator [Azospirillum palustre]
MLQPATADDRMVATLVTRALAVLDHDPDGARRCLDRLASLFIDRRDEPAAVAAPPPSRGGLTSWQLRRVTGHIEANIARPLRVETLAALVGLSSGHFTAAFKASTGETPHSYVIGRRVHLAQRLMLETDEPLCQIACACGFADQAHLTRLFGARVGQTPLRWRKAGRRLRNTETP